jgi:hypothetical protein
MNIPELLAAPANAGVDVVRFVEELAGPHQGGGDFLVEVVLRLIHFCCAAVLLSANRPPVGRTYAASSLRPVATRRGVTIAVIDLSLSGPPS